MEWKRHHYTVSTDKRRLDLEVIRSFLNTSYWGASRTEREIRTTIEKSICFGLFDAGRQIGFARAISDEAVISWIGDVFVIPEFQRKGLGKWLMKCVLSHPSIKGTKCILNTKDAHGLYEKFGFKRVELMSRSEDGTGPETIER